MAKSSRTRTNGTSAPPKTMGALSDVQRPEKNTTISVQNKLEITCQQITEINQLRKALNDLGLATKSTLLKAETAKKKRAAGGSKTVVDNALRLNEEVNLLLKDVQALLKDLEINKMDLTNGTLHPGSFNLANSKAALIDLNARYIEIQTTHNTPAPIDKRGRGGKPNVARGGQGKPVEEGVENGSEVVGGGRVRHPKAGDESKATQSGEVHEGQGSAMKPKVARAVRGKKPETSVAKVGGKRGRGSGDDEPRLSSKTHSKKVKITNNESDNSMSSDLTPPEESSNLGDSDNEADMNLVPPPQDDPTLATTREHVPTSVPQPVPEAHGDEDIEMTSSTTAGGPVTPQAAFNPANNHESEPLPNGNPAETTNNDMASDTTDNAVNKSADKTAEVADDMANEEEDNSNSDHNAPDSAVADTAPNTEGPKNDSAVPNRVRVSDVHDDRMQLAAAVDADDLHKHVIAHKALVEKETEAEVTKTTKKGTNKSKRETLRVKWDALTEEEQDKKQAIAKQQIHAFLRNPTTYRIPVNTRAMIREIAEFCIPACQTTRELALHVLENKYHNLFCIYHQTTDKAGRIHDRSGHGAFRVTGTPFSRLANEKPIKLHPVTALVERRPGYLHCGCSEDEALLEFYWWKLAEATSPTTDETEGWLDHRKMDPRTRTLMFGFFTTWTRMEVNDIYVSYPINTSFEARMTRFDKKIARLQAAKVEEVEEEARRVKREEAQRIEKEQKVAARKKEKRNQMRLAI